MKNYMNQYNSSFYGKTKYLSISKTHTEE